MVVPVCMLGNDHDSLESRKRRFVCDREERAEDLILSAAFEVV